PNGRAAGAPHISRYPSTGAVAACRGYQFAGVGTGAGTAGRRGRGYRRSASSEVTAPAGIYGGGGVFVAKPPPVGGRTAAVPPASGAGVGATAAGSGGVRRPGVVSAAEDMHLAAVAMARARIGRISSRF
ncbi:unnamed protein product, partial [Ectocarpus sp. 13 AM-2016]